MQFIKWCQFQWPWTNPNPIFKVTPLFDAKYLTNGYRYGHSYYKRRIANRTQASNGTNFNDFEWPLTPISRSRYYSTSNNSIMVQDKAILQWRTNRKLYMFYQTAPFSITFNNPNPHFKVRPFFGTECLQHGYRYCHSYYGRRIGNRSQAFKWYHFQWSWVTSNPHFKVMIIFNVK